jgi:predicted adenylyl cyclase CyaB
MDIRLNREIKAYCPDFVPVRQLLRGLGAAFVETREQVDFFYHLPATSDEQGTRRLKLRIENGKTQLIYYYGRQETGARTSQSRLWEVRDPQVQAVLEAALGVRVVIRKQRELWHKDNVIFNLDTVEGIGQVFEVEVLAQEGADIEAQVAENRRRFGPYLGPDISGSNEDLVGG